MLVDLCPARSDAWRGWKASGGDVGRRQARGQPPRSTDHAYRAATRNRRERGRVCWSGWSTWWSERMPCSSAAPWGPLDALGRGPQSTENRPLCGGCESKVRGRRQPQNSRELAPMGWWTRPYAQTPVVWAFFACSTAPEYLGIARYFDRLCLKMLRHTTSYFRGSVLDYLSNQRRTKQRVDSFWCVL